MTGKTLSDLGKNPGKASRQSLTSVTCAKNSFGRGGGGGGAGWYSPRIYPHLSLKTVFPALILTQICKVNINIFFLKTVDVIINWLFHIYHHSQKTNSGI